MEIEIKSGNTGVEQLYGDIMAYIMSKQVNFIKDLEIFFCPKFFFLFHITHLLGKK